MPILTLWIAIGHFNQACFTKLYGNGFYDSVQNIISSDGVKTSSDSLLPADIVLVADVNAKFPKKICYDYTLYSTNTTVTSTVTPAP